MEFPIDKIISLAEKRAMNFSNKATAFVGLGLCIFFSSFFPSQLRAEDFSQAGSQETASKLNNRGSDDSMQAATNSAMVAVMNLAALNIPGAFSNGYRAYGQYINSEKLDDLERKNQQRKGSMASIGYAPMGGNAGTSSGGGGKNGGGITGTTFSRLDPNFLYKGESAEIAAEFEKRSGMKREEFLQHLGSATDSDITFQDPNLLQKIEGRFEQFKAGIRNQDFRNGLDRAASMFSPSMRAEALAKIQSYYNEQWQGGSPSAPMVATESSGSASGEKGTQAASAAANASAVENSLAEKVAQRSPASSGPQSMEKNLFIGISSQDSQATINELFSQSAANENDSIFQKVSKKYRTLTPAMLGVVSNVR